MLGTGFSGPLQGALYCGGYCMVIGGDRNLVVGGPARVQVRRALALVRTNGLRFRAVLAFKGVAVEVDGRVFPASACGDALFQGFR